MHEQTLLIGDIGGTNARFALATTDKVGFMDAKTLQCADFPSSIAAITHYLDQVAAPAPLLFALPQPGRSSKKRFR